MNMLRLFVFYLHQLREEVHGYWSAFVEEHWRASQETFRGGVKERGSRTGEESCFKHAFVPNSKLENLSEPEVYVN